MASLGLVLPHLHMEPFSIATECGSTVRGYSRGLKDPGDGRVLVLIHGYPQT